MTTQRWRSRALIVLPALMAAPHAAMAADLPLLDQQVIRAPWARACDGQPDATPLPVDPRTLVKEGVNTRARRSSSTPGTSTCTTRPSPSWPSCRRA